MGDRAWSLRVTLLSSILLYLVHHLIMYIESLIPILDFANIPSQVG